MRQMVMTMSEIKERVKPIAERYEIPVLYVFGSYARNEAKESSDIDFLVGTLVCQKNIGGLCIVIFSMN